MTTATIYLEVCGQPVAASKCHWLQIAPCGCMSGISRASSAGEVHLTGEDAFNWDTPKVVRDRDAKLGFTYLLVTMEQYRADWYEKFKIGCQCTPMWGIDPTPVPAGWTWMTTDPYGGRRTHRKHLVPVGSEAYQQGVKPKALCGKEDSMWCDDSRYMDDTVECGKCEKRARDTSPVLVPVGPVADVSVAGGVL
jgi:hypothetical protein